MSALKSDPARFGGRQECPHLRRRGDEDRPRQDHAYSPLLKVAGDYSCGIFDTTGNMVAQGPDLPIHLGSMPDAVRAIVHAFPDAAPGDVFIHNDPYHGGSHLPDVNVVAPAFHGDTLLGFGCVRAHWPDIGSATPGSYGAVTEIFGEGLRLPPGGAPLSQRQARPRHRGDHLRQCPHPDRAHGRPARPGRRRTGAPAPASPRSPRNTAPPSCWRSCRKSRTTRNE